MNSYFVTNVVDLSTHHRCSGCPSKSPAGKPVPIHRLQRCFTALTPTSMSGQREVPNPTYPAEPVSPPPPPSPGRSGVRWPQPDVPSPRLQWGWDEEDVAVGNLPGVVEHLPGKGSPMDAHCGATRDDIGSRPGTNLCSVPSLQVSLYVFCWNWCHWQRKQT